MKIRCDGMLKGYKLFSLLPVYVKIIDIQKDIIFLEKGHLHIIITRKL